MYYLYNAKNIALKNDHIFHLFAWTKIGKSYVYGVNSTKSSTRFGRRYPNGLMGYHLHAEMDLLKKIKGFDVKEISIVRFTKSGTLTMAKPCRFCQKFLKKAGIKRVNYTDWNGSWKILKLNQEN